ncbi:uncharacterized protein LOC129582788 [Paramacrobiotus metropolitanus]|uniref:uncharacterized protein LOC129582788 n=1 Tax=Paramacrobiotus metropolitanus TaxID=2943436 RepID=UPI00244623A1|nr:uncharacterized protein LOC129582788 [Paramacrobiotus metropolitanus]
MGKAWHLGMCRFPQARFPMFAYFVENKLLMFKDSLSNARYVGRARDAEKIALAGHTIDREFQFMLRHSRNGPGRAVLSHQGSVFTQRRGHSSLAPSERTSGQKRKRQRIRGTGITDGDVGATQADPRELDTVIEADECESSCLAATMAEGTVISDVSAETRTSHGEGSSPARSQRATSPAPARFIGIFSSAFDMAPASCLNDVNPFGQQTSRTGGDGYIDDRAPDFAQWNLPPVAHEVILGSEGAVIQPVMPSLPAAEASTPNPEGPTEPSPWSSRRGSPDSQDSESCDETSGSDADVKTLFLMMVAMMKKIGLALHVMRILHLMATGNPRLSHPHSIYRLLSVNR